MVKIRFYPVLAKKSRLLYFYSLKNYKLLFMKQLSSFLLSVTVLLAACNNNKSKDTATFTSEDGKEKVTVDMKQMQNAAADMEKQKAELEKLTPLTIDQLKAMIPETLMGVARKNFNASTTMGAGLATAKYEINDSMDIKLNIYDCAGSGGAGIYSLQYLGMMNMQQESDDEYTKTVDFNGGKAFVMRNNIFLFWALKLSFTITIEIILVLFKVASIKSFHIVWITFSRLILTLLQINSLKTRVWLFHQL